MIFNGWTRNDRLTKIFTVRLIFHIFRVLDLLRLFHLWFLLYFNVDLASMLPYRHMSQIYLVNLRSPRTVEADSHVDWTF